MAFGFSPKHIERKAIEGLSQEQFIVIAIEAAKKLSWDISYISGTGIIAYTKFSFSSFGEEIKITVNDNKATFISSCIGSQLMDWGKNKQNIKEFISVFKGVKSSFTLTELDEKVEELKSNLEVKGEQIVSQSLPSANKRIGDLLSIFKPSKGYIITPILIDLNILIFLFMVMTGVNIFTPDNESMLRWGANFRPMTLDGEWWRLITSYFIHIGVFHLLMNMYALLYIGTLLEPRLGTSRFTAAYLLTGLCASLASLWWNYLSISAGASGAIFGMYGVFLALLTTNLIERNARRAFLVSIAVFVLYNLLNGLNGGIDNAAHIGGLISGIIIGYAFYPSLDADPSPKQKYSTIGVITVVVILMSLIVYNKVPNDLPEYNERMQQFSSNESMALEIYRMSENSPKEELMYEIQNRGIYYWNENIKLVSELDRLELPDFIHKRNIKLIQYCKLRIKSYELLYKAVKEDRYKYRRQIDDYERQINTVILELRSNN